mmetsp:Transcript_6252/g.7927  ORF Transcript_6252/g.7927 Transcript_6252/m.7927 type:complete len:211 (-) Transcript_6252:97-729(-)
MKHSNHRMATNGMILQVFCLWISYYMGCHLVHVASSFVIRTSTSARLHIINNRIHPSRMSLPVIALELQKGESSSESTGEGISIQTEPLCDLQTLLRLAGCLDTGGSAKVAIQSGSCILNGAVETRRAKKLFPGDIVTFQGVDYPVQQIVCDKNYVLKVKTKKIKPMAKIDEFGNKEFGGRFRSNEWRAERKQKKANRKSRNNNSIMEKD